MKQHPYAKKSIVLLLLLCGGLFVLLFAALLRYDLRTPQQIDPADYNKISSNVTTPNKFVYTCDVQQNSGALSFAGYALFAGERFLQVDTSVVLYCAQTGDYAKLPTAMSPSDAATSAINDGINYSFGGYYAFVSADALSQPLSAYEICFAYRSSGHNLLIHTGQSAEVLA